jgi:hypothetical protein
MTKCTVIFDQPKQGKPIEFVKVVDDKIEVAPPYTEPKEWNNIELIARKCYKNLDVMFAYDDRGRESGMVVFGHWNDGYAE